MMVCLVGLDGDKTKKVKGGKVKGTLIDQLLRVKPKFDDRELD